VVSDCPTIVVLNDDPVQLHLLSRLLEGAGYDVDAYLDPSEALAHLSSEPRPRVDAFAIDLHMPGIDGWKVCGLLRSPEFLAYNETPILVVSATFSGADVEAITADLGADGFLSVPFSRDGLLGHVRDLLDGVRPESRPHALVIEDDEAVGRTVERTFSTHGYAVHVATSVSEAKRLWLDVGPDVVILDYHLPDGTALDLLARLHSPADRTVVLVVTGDDNPALSVRLLQAGADGCVPKPFDPEYLVELAAKARRQRSLLRVEALLERRTRELRSSESRYRSLFEAIPDLVVTLDAEDRIIGANEEAIRALGPDPTHVQGKSFLPFAPAEQLEALREGLAQVRSVGRARFETILAGARGDALAVEITAAAATDADPGAVLVVARDLTERRRAEEERRRLDAQVQHAQRLESLGVLAGGIAHDFNNLLVGVLGNASLALLDTQPGTSVHECIGQIETAARRAAELTQQILTFSGKSESTMSPQDISSVVSEMGQLLAPAVSRRAELNYRLRPDIPAVRADASQIRQVIMNLIMNASDALGDAQGHIDVSTDIRRLSRGELKDYYLGDRSDPGDYVSVEVADDGCGMDDDTKRQIFDPFFTTKFAGRGLGLAATLGIVRAHHGMLSVESTPGRGTTFRILLPALMAKTQPAGTAEGVANEGSGWKGSTILVVDNEPSVRHLASTALTRAGLRVLQAVDGPTCLEAVQSDGSIDLVILDLTMPSMNGVEVLREIRKAHGDLPVLLSSGYLDDALPENVLAAGVTAFLRKPYSPRELVERTTELLAAKRGRDPHVQGGEFLRPSG
jgi:PAS domain S-box-containing protein